MVCGTCGTENPQGANFCSQCGDPLSSRCPQCETPTETSANFCPNCGTRLDAPVVESADSGERRLVTALFADLVGFTPLTESRDAEEVRGMLLRYFDRAREVVQRYGGEIDKYTGDAVTAFWGARVARENDAERAVRAALDLVDAVGRLGEELGIPELSLRAGILSGETSVGEGGNELGLVVGDIVNTAARLQAAAAAGTVLVGDATRALAADAIEFEPVGEMELKGKSEPVSTYRPVRVLAGPRSSEGGIEPPFVGREPELRMLEDQLRATSREGRARLVSIIGEGGIGKSRLASEMADLVAAMEDGPRWHRGRSPEYGDGVTFWAFGEMVRDRAGIAETDDPDESRAKLEATVAEHSPDPEERRWLVPRLAGLLGLDPMPSGGREDLFGALRTFFQRESEHGPVILAFEDLQWADEGLLEFIVELVERSTRRPILVITLARPDLLDRHPDWGSARGGFSSLHLGPLSDGDMAALVAGTVPGIEPDTVDLLVESAAGVPLYAVEYIRMLLDSGELVPDGDRFREVGSLDRLRLPDSLHAMVASRLDRLDPSERAVVQDAAVLGQSFTLERLATATGRSVSDFQSRIDRLVRADVLRLNDDHGSPERGQYTFVQSTIREVAYGRLSLAERRKRHLAIVERFEGAGPEFAGIVASHYLSAFEAGSDPELADRARDALFDAAQRAAALHASRQGLGLVEQALEIPGADTDRARLWDLGASVASAAHEHETALDMAGRALDWWTENGDEEETIRATALLAWVNLEAGHPRRGIEVIEGAFDIELAGGLEMARLGFLLSNARLNLGDREGSADMARRMLEAATRHGNLELISKLLQVRGLSLHYLGRVYESHALLMEAVRLAREVGSPALESQAISTLTFGDGRNGRRRDLELPLRLKEIAEKAASPAVERRGVVWISRVLTAMGEFEQARDGYRSLELSGDRVLDRYDRSRIGFLDWVIDGDVGRLEDSSEEVRFDESGSDDTSKERATLVASVWAQNAFAEGDSEAAYGLAMSADHSNAVPHSFLFDTPVFAALRLRDPDRLQRARAVLQTGAGPRFDSIDAVAAASLALLEGGSEQAVRDFIRIAEEHGIIDGEVETAKLKAMLAEILPDDPIARAAGREALDWFTAHGAKGYVDLFADVWASLDIQELDRT